MKIENLIPSDFNNLKAVLESKGVYTGDVFQALVKDIEDIQGLIMTEFEKDKGELQKENEKLKLKLQDNSDEKTRKKSFIEMANENRLIDKSTYNNKDEIGMTLHQKMVRRRIIK